MAITILNEPPDKASVNNEMIFVVYEADKATDPVTYVDYKYICNIYSNSVLIGTLKTTPDPTYSYGIFNVSDILRSYVTYGLDISSTVVDYTASVSYQVTFTEEYN
jgi:hypothetical protein